MVLLSSSLYFLLVTSLFVCGNGATIFYDFILTRKLVSPDGYQKSALVINGELIGPTIEAFVGDTVIVNVTNLAYEQEAFSIHWHGVTGLANPWQDGAQSVTNCPIPYGTSYEQTFTALGEGTHFYHAHTGNTRAEGTYGVIAFSSRTPKHHYDSEISLILSDWYHESILDLTAGLLNNPFKWVYNGNSILMNGKGLSKECSNDTSVTTTTTEVSYSDGSVSQTSSTCQGNRERLIVEPGKTYLLRLVNAASLGYYSFAVAGHSMTIIGTGSSATVPSVVNSVELSAGQRMEVLITCDQHTLDPNTPTEAYSFTTQVQSDYRGPDNTFSGIGNGYLSYVNPTTPSSDLQFNTLDPIAPVHESRPWDTWHPLLKQDTTHSEFQSPPQESVASHVFVTQQEWVDSESGRGFTPAINASVADDSTMSLAWTLNGQRLMLDKTPFLLTSYLTQQIVENPSIIRLNLGDVVDITIQNSVAGNGVCESHPWHVHGHPGWLIGEGPGEFDPNVDPANYNLVDPPYMDTVTNFPSVNGGQRGGVFERGVWQTPCGWFTMRMEVTLPGMWFFHCHIDWHMTMGMGLVLDVESETVDRYPEDMPLCGDAVAEDVYREDSSSDSEDGGGSFTSSEVMGIAFGVFFAALIVVAIGFYIYLTKTTVGRHQMASDSTPMHMQNEDRNL